MKTLTRNEMKNVRGGGPIIPGCPYGQSCDYVVNGQVLVSYCGNVYQHGGFVCGCINSGLLCLLNN